MARLEAFCDGVFAIALTLLIIDIRLPPPAATSTADLWHKLRELTPAIFAFLLSFAVILTTWVNHHSTMRLVAGSSPPFVFANGLLLLSVVFIPFPAALLGEYLFTDHSAPAVVLYSGVCALQAIGWICVTGAATGRHPLTRDHRATQEIRAKSRYGYYSLALYTVLALVAFWLPRTVAGVIGVMSMLWLVLALQTTEE
jgi:uncharacterized membrane protein